MDNVTHALAGALLGAVAVAVVERRGALAQQPVPPAFRTAAFTVGIIAAELPDSDLVYAGQSLGMGKLGYLLHHRGHTHTVLFALLGAALLWAVVLLLKRELRAAPASHALLALAVAGTLSHLLLDFGNSYGVHPFWPVDNRWFYGDAVFIVEPWFWVISIPVLFLIARRRWTRALLGVLLIAVLVAAWRLPMVAQGIAMAFTIAVVGWTLLLRATPRHRLALGIGGWCLAEAIFFVASGRARSSVQASLRAAAPGSTYVDAAITPLVGNPLCSRVLLMELDGDRYRVTETTVAPFPSLETAEACARSAGSFPDALSADAAVSGAERGNTSAIVWGTAWSAPLIELRALATGNCEIAAALQFIRVPMWAARGGSTEFWDARFGNGARGFASIVTPARPATCPAHVPGWAPPRRDLLG